jgi:hypothetical protein
MMINKIYILLGSILAVPFSYASDLRTPYEGSIEKPVKAFYVGAGFSHKLIHLNAEWVNPYGVAYVKGGVFLSGDRVPGGQIGFRMPVYLTNKEKNGYHVGVYGGYVDRKWVDDDDKARLGVGVDLAYVKLNRERVSTFSMGVAVAEKLTDREGDVVADVEPRLQFSYTLSFGL